MPEIGSVKRIIVKNTTFQLIGKILSMSITVLVTILITRTYGREDYGSFSLMQGIPALFFIIVDFGLNAISVREASRDKSKLFSYFFNILIFRVFLSSLFIFLLSFGLSFFPYSKELISGIRMGLFLILTQALYATTNIIFQSRLRYGLSTLGYAAGYLFILIGCIFLIFRSAPIKWVNFTYVLGGIVTFILNFILIMRLDIPKKFSLDLDLIKRLFIQSLPLGIMFVFSQMSFKEDILLLSLLPVPLSFGVSSTEAVGIYSLPYKVFEVSLVLPAFFMNSVYPLLLEYREESKEALLSRFRKVLVFLTAAGSLVGVLGIFFAPWIIRFLGGVQFSQSVPVLRILMGGLFLFYVTQPLSWLIVTLGYQKYLPGIYLISTIFNLALNLIFIPKYSFYAAAAVTLSSELLILLLLAFFAQKSWRNYYAS